MSGSQWRSFSTAACAQAARHSPWEGRGERAASGGCVCVSDGSTLPDSWQETGAKAHREELVAAECHCLLSFQWVIEEHWAEQRWTSLVKWKRTTPSATWDCSQATIGESDLQLPAEQTSSLLESKAHTLPNHLHHLSTEVPWRLLHDLHKYCLSWDQCLTLNASFLSYMYKPINIITWNVWKIPLNMLASLSRSGFCLCCDIYMCIISRGHYSYSTVCPLIPCGDANFRQYITLPEALDSCWC